MQTSLSVPQEVLDSFNATREAEGMESRSRAVREAMQEYIERHTQFEDIEGDAMAAVAFDYEHTLVKGGGLPSSGKHRSCIYQREAVC